MEELILELDDETAAWLEASAASQHQTISEFVAQLIRDSRKAMPADNDQS